MREAAKKARESLRATINEDHLTGSEYQEVFGRRRAAPKRLGDDAEYNPVKCAPSLARAPPRSCPESARPQLTV